MGYFAKMIMGQFALIIAMLVSIFVLGRPRFAVALWWAKGRGHQGAPFLLREATVQRQRPADVVGSPPVDLSLELAPGIPRLRGRARVRAEAVLLPVADPRIVRRQALPQPWDPRSDRSAG